METINVKIAIRAPIQRVWDELTNHEGMIRWPGIRHAKLRRPGTHERNGHGAIREVKAFGVSFVEEIVAFEAPTLMRYQIIEAKPRIDHEGGSVRLTENGNETQVVWTTRFQLGLPILGKPLTRLLRPLTQRSFARCLEWVKRHLESNE